jgi:hypothetical protein
MEMLAYYNTTATSPHYMYLCYYMHPRDGDDASTPATYMYADARRIYNIRSAPLHHPALSLPPASRSRPQYRVAAQSNTAAGRLHTCCMLHSPPVTRVVHTVQKQQKVDLRLRKQFTRASTDDRVCKLTRWISSYRQA